VELSDRARALQVANESLNNLQLIRKDRVESLKQSIKNGSYQVPGEKIAERMLGEGLFA
jgi:negative regulator of flagellin synthesis FlgM